MSQFDLQSTTRSPSTGTADVGIVDKDSVRPGTEEDKPGTSLTVEEWATQMQPYFHAASQIDPNFGGGAGW